MKELLPIRHSRMAASPFAFYRGAAAVMADDLGAEPSTGLHAQLCGDAHLSNFGLFAAPDRALVFDVNDFDETYRGPFEWDVLRLVASFAIAARDADHPPKAQREAAQAAAQSYRLAIREYAGMDDLAVFYDRVDAALLLDLAKDVGGKDSERRVAGVMDKARRRDRWSVLRKLTESGPDGPRFIDDPPLLARLSVDAAYREVVEGMFDDYQRTLLPDRRELAQRYRVIDVAHKVVGVGSVGLRAFVLLMAGRDDSDLLILQAKQAVASVLESQVPGAPESSAMDGGDHGDRVVIGQRLMQAATDIFLGHVRGPLGRSYYVRQLRDMKWSPDLGRMSLESLRGYAILCGRTLARAHARSGDAIAIAAYVGDGTRFETALADFAERYADQNARDHAEFTRAIAEGRLSATDDERAATLQSIETGMTKLAHQSTD